MPNNRFLIVFLFIQIFFGAHSYAYEKTLTKIEITKLANEAKELIIKGHYEKSLLKSSLALQHAITICDNSLIAYSYKLIATNFDELGESEKAFLYYNKSLIYADKTNDNDLKNRLNNNLGNIYFFDRKQYKKGIAHYKKSLEYSKKIKDFSQNSLTKLNITWAYFDIGHYNEGLPYLKSINSYYKNHKDNSIISTLNMLNGMFYNHINDNEKAEAYFQNSIKLGIEENNEPQLSFAYKEYSKHLLKIGAYRKAYESLELYDKISEEINDDNEINKNNISGLKLELEETKKNIKKTEIRYLQEIRLAAEQRIRNQRIIITFIVTFILLGLLLYFFYQNAKLTQKNKIKSIQNIEQQNIIIATIDGQEKERKKIAAFLHDNISAKLSTVCLHLFAFTAITKIESEEIVKAKEILKEIHDAIRNLSHQLIPCTLIKFGLLNALEDLCEKNSNSLLKFNYFSKIPLEKRYNEDYEMKLYFIVAELLNNIQKHSKASAASIALEEKNKEIIITIKDDGKGFNTNKTIHHVGFGLTQIRARVSKMKGELSIFSTPITGTFIQMKIPIKEIH
ncbi:tetratricopeptide repeat-containing sensor histidine kinase [Flavobacterium psychrotolerans]|uniref:histidine kinase n=1 Tax=Flavobacterium psychrotolerans TaxID=2169410 RepID=A0A2U1JR05_9FLAO|nr:ATP-binding protein [Flavobacterium psychrotolerans]PWA07389.1 two-component sensor histidine kinase [Flavobacterium psychrotolerans]